MTLIEDNASKCSLNYLIDRRVLKDASIVWLNESACTAALLPISAIAKLFNGRLLDRSSA